MKQQWHNVQPKFMDLIIALNSLAYSGHAHFKKRRQNAFINILAAF